MTPAELTDYFTAEKQGACLLVVIAIAGLGFAAYLWFGRSAYLAMAWPLIVVSVLALAVGLGVGLRTPSQVAGLEQGLQTAKTDTVAAEIKRMDKVNRSFRVIKVVEITLVAVALLLVALLPIPSTWASVGMGLLLEASVLLVFDTIAHHRAEVYAKWLQSLVS